MSRLFYDYFMLHRLRKGVDAAIDGRIRSALPKGNMSRRYATPFLVTATHSACPFIFIPSGG